MSFKSKLTICSFHERLFYILPIVFFSVIPQLGCSEESPSSPEKENNDEFNLKTSVTIGPSGGNISDEEFSLTVPAGSFNQESQIKLYSKDDDTLFGENTVTKLFKLEGLPADYKNPLKIAIKYNRTIANESYIAVSKDVTDEITSEPLTLYNLENVNDSSGYLVGYLTPVNGSSSISLNLDKKTNEIDKVLQGLDGYVSSVTNNFKIIYPKSYGPYITKLSSVLEKNYSIIEDSLGLFFETKYLLQGKFQIEIGAIGNYPTISLTQIGHFLISRNSEKEFGQPEFAIESGRLLLREAVEDQYDSRIIPQEHLWLFYAIRTWSAEMFSSSQDFDLSDFNSNSLAAFKGISVGAGNSNTSATDHGFGMSVLFKYLFDNKKLEKYHVGEIIGLMQLGKNPTTALIETINELKGDWLPNFFINYAETNIYNVSNSIFTENLDGEWSINDDNNILKLFGPSEIGTYPDLSAKRFMVNLNHSTIDESKKLQITIEGEAGSDGLSTAVFSYKNSQLDYLGKSVNGSIEISDLKGFYENDIKQFLIVAVNSNGTPTNFTGNSNVYLTLKVEDKNTTLNYTKCWVKVTTGSLEYLKKNLITGNTFTASTGGESFGEINYTGSFTDNKFVGIFDEVYDNGNQIDTITGTVTVELNETLDMVTSVSFKKESKSSDNSLNSNSTRNIEFNGENIPLQDFNDQSTFEIEGTQTCDHISLLDVYKKVIIPNDPNNNYEETLQSYKCNTGTERITILFSTE